MCTGQKRRLAIALFVAALSPASARADEPVHRLTLKEASAHAIEKHPIVAVANAKELAAAARVDVARAEAAPKIAVIAQFNRSTGNVIPGATFAMPGIPGV